MLSTGYIVGSFCGTRVAKILYFTMKMEIWSFDILSYLTTLLITLEKALFPSGSWQAVSARSSRWRRGPTTRCWKPPTRWPRPLCSSPRCFLCFCRRRREKYNQTDITAKTFRDLALSLPLVVRPLAISSAALLQAARYYMYSYGDVDNYGGDWIGQEPYMNDNIPITNQFVKEGLVVGMVGKQRKYSMEQADIPNIRYWNNFLLVIWGYIMYDISYMRIWVNEDMRIRPTSQTSGTGTSFFGDCEGCDETSEPSSTLSFFSRLSIDQSSHQIWSSPALSSKHVGSTCTLYTYPLLCQPENMEAQNLNFIPE